MGATLKVTAPALLMSNSAASAPPSDQVIARPSGSVAARWNTVPVPFSAKATVVGPAAKTGASFTSVTVTVRAIGVAFTPSEAMTVRS